MEVTEVRIRLVRGDNTEKLRAFATITLDREFVVRDMRIIDGNHGLFVAMPSRKMTERCRRCGAKNAVRSSYCSDCGQKLEAPKPAASPETAQKAHVDIAHPVTTACRERIHAAVIAGYEKALAQAPAAEDASPLDPDALDEEIRVRPAEPRPAPAPTPASDPDAS